MKSTLTRSSAVAALLYASAAHGSAIRYCPSGADSVCFQVAVPEVSASSNKGNIYFQISAPTTYQWVALGTGSGMPSSNIFLMYQDGQGNLTLSPRLGTQYTEPTLDTSPTAAQLTLLAGSGVSADGNTMTANVACSNCNTWNDGSGSMSLSSTSSDWIAAWMSGSSLRTTSQSATISRHDDTVTFKLDLTKATVSSDSNPFIDSGSDSSDGSGGGDSGGDGSSSNGGGVTVTDPVINRGTTLVAHGIIMAIVMVILYPAGSLLMPLLRNWAVHAIFQLLSFVLMWVGFGLGVKVANQRDMLFKQTHTTFGTVIVCLFVLQPVLGWFHHQHFLKHQQRGPVSYGHIWYGRILMLLGVINGGLGLKLVNEKNNLVVAYSVVAGIMGVLYIGGKAVTKLSRRKLQSSSGPEDGAKYSDGPSYQQTQQQSPRRTSTSRNARRSDRQNFI